MIFKILAVLLSTFIGFSTFAEPVKILRCKSQHSFFDPEYVQGSEIFGDIYFDRNSGKASLEIESMEKSKATLYTFEENRKVNFSNKQSSGYLEWVIKEKKDYASLVYLGPDWGFVIDVSEFHPNLDWAGIEIEMMCSETENFEIVLK